MSSDLGGLRVVVVPRWGGSSTSDFYPWLAERIRERSPAADVRVLDMPDPETPRVDAWPSAVRDGLGDDPGVLRRTIVVAHSVGCQALLRALATLRFGERVSAALFVAGWWTVDEPWESLLPWQADDYDRMRARSALGRSTLLVSTNDPFTADFESNALIWRTDLGSEVAVEDGAKHFNASEEPAVWRELERLMPQLN